MLNYLNKFVVVQVGLFDKFRFYVFSFIMENKKSRSFGIKLFEKEWHDELNYLKKKVIGWSCFPSEIELLKK